MALGDAFDGNVDVINQTLAPGAKVETALNLTPKAGTGKGSYQLCVEGTVGGREVKKTKGFILGAHHAVPRQSIHIDGDASDWDAAKIPAEVADTKEQVLLGKDAWRGPADLSAKMRLAWASNYVLSIIVEVTDDRLVTTHRRDKSTESDSVQLFIDGHAPEAL